MIDTLDKEMVSVVITCFNYAKYLSKSLESALSQTYANLEIIVVNDGSTDNTDDIMLKYASDSRIIYIKQKNKGQAIAKNIGIRHARGSYVAFLDADDIWCKEKLDKQMVCFEKKSIGVVYCKANYVDENDAVFNYEMTGAYLQSRRGKVTKWLLYDNFVQFSSTVVRRECFEKFGIFDESLKMGIDWDLWLRISTGYEFDFIDDRLFYYRMGHSSQMSKNITERQRCADIIMGNFLKNYLYSICREDIKKSLAYTYCNRGNYYRKVDKMKSYNMYFKSIMEYPFDISAYKGIVKTIFS